MAAKIQDHYKMMISKFAILKVIAPLFFSKKVLVFGDKYCNDKSTIN